MAAKSSKIDWSEAIDGQGGMAEHIFSLQHQLHFLMIDLESAFDRDRAHKEDHVIQYYFQQDGIDATLWLCAQAWSTAKTLTEVLEGLQRRLDVESCAK